MILPTFTELKEALKAIVAEKNWGFWLNMWTTVVDRDGVVKNVVFSGNDRGEQWPGSRVISAQKANTANAFSLPGLALSTANLFTATQPGQSLFGLQHSNPVNIHVAYDGDSELIGTENDAMIGGKIGWVNVFGWGLALYNEEWTLLWAVWVSGDSSTADHNIAWKLRNKLGLDYVPSWVNSDWTDNIVNDIVEWASASGWGHPETTPEAKQIAADFVNTNPVSKK